MRAVLLSVFLTALVSLVLPGSARAEVFMLELATPPATNDKRPYIDIIIKDNAGAEVGVKTLVDGGSSFTIIIDPLKAEALGLQIREGTPATSRGGGGDMLGFTGVPIPNERDAKFKNTSSPPGQANKQPGLPSSTAVFNLPERGTPDKPADGEGNIGSGFLNQFGTHGVVKGKGKTFYKLIKQDQYDTAEKAKKSEEEALKIAFPVDTPPTGPDGKPVDTKKAPITPTTPKDLPAGEKASDSGFNIEMFLRNPLIGQERHASFIIKSGSGISLISESLAAMLGLAPIGANLEIDVNFSTFEVPLVDLQMDPFGMPTNGSLLFPVGILPDSLNPFGDNLLGNDFLDRFFYWGIDTVRNEFYAAAAPEPTAFALIGLGIAGIAVAGRRNSKGVRS